MPLVMTKNETAGGEVRGMSERRDKGSYGRLEAYGESIDAREEY